VYLGKFAICSFDLALSDPFNLAKSQQELAGCNMQRHCLASLLRYSRHVLFITPSIRRFVTKSTPSPLHSGDEVSAMTKLKFG
jgi:hypothetical protein